MRTILPLFQEVDRFVHRDAVNPRVKARIALKGFQGGITLYKRFLRQIIGILMVGRHVVDRGVNSLLIAANKFVVSSHISFLCVANEDDMVGRGKGRLGLLGRRHFKFQGAAKDPGGGSFAHIRALF